MDHGDAGGGLVAIHRTSHSPAYHCRLGDSSAWGAFTLAVTRGVELEPGREARHRGGAHKARLADPGRWRMALSDFGLLNRSTTVAHHSHRLLARSGLHQR